MSNKSEVFSTKTLETPKISIIIPCYNCEEYIDFTLESITNQIYNNIEIICINDGSTDNTMNKLTKWIKYENINLKVLEQKNLGVSCARNYGIQESTGKYIFFCDADDCFNPLLVSQFIKYISLYSVDYVYCLLSHNFNKAMSKKFDKFRIESTYETMKNLLYRMGEISFSCFIYKRDILLQNNLYFDEKTKYFEDREFNWKYILYCKKGVFIPSSLYWYRVNYNSVTHSNITWRKTDMLDAINRTEQYLVYNKSPIVNEFKKYMFPRAMWSVAKAFSVNGNYLLYEKLLKNYDVRLCMKQTCMDKNFLVRLSSFLFLLNPKLFYWVIKIHG